MDGLTCLADWTIENLQRILIKGLLAEFLECLGKAIITLRIRDALETMLEEVTVGGTELLKQDLVVLLEEVPGVVLSDLGEATASEEGNQILGPDLSLDNTVVVDGLQKRFFRCLSHSDDAITFNFTETNSLEDIAEFLDSFVSIVSSNNPVDARAKVRVKLRLLFDMITELFTGSVDDGLMICTT